MVIADHMSHIKAIPMLPAGSWKDGLIVNRAGQPKAILANAIMACRSPEWQGVLGFNEFASVAVSVNPAPWPGARVGNWTDEDDRLAADWMQREGVCVSVPTAGQAIQTVAKERPFHPVREYLDSLHWDGVPRLSSWLTTYLNVPNTEYSAAVGSRWLISGVARIYRPGAKVDHCLILEGPQGSKKSTALRVLTDPWFADDIADLGTKDAALQVRGVWVVEIAELDSMTRPEVGRVKSFLSRNVDRFRPPYGRRLIEVPRQCIFAGTTNRCAYLRDETGGRRFWPVRCGDIDISALQTDRDQLWAEAREQFGKNVAWWLDTAELTQQAEEEQRDRYEEEDVWDGVINRFIANVNDVSIEEILTKCIGKPADRWNQGDKNRIAKCLRSSGWERYNSGPRGARKWRYRRV